MLLTRRARELRPVAERILAEHEELAVQSVPTATPALKDALRKLSDL